MRWPGAKMAKKDDRQIITLACTECKERTYTTSQEPAERSGPAGAEQVLPALPDSPRASRSSVDTVARTGAVKGRHEPRGAASADDPEAPGEDAVVQAVRARARCGKQEAAAAEAAKGKTTWRDRGIFRGRSGTSSPSCGRSPGRRERKWYASPSPSWWWRWRSDWRWARVDLFFNWLVDNTLLR